MDFGCVGVGEGIALNVLVVLVVTGVSRFQRGPELIGFRQMQQLLQGLFRVGGGSVQSD